MGDTEKRKWTSAERWMIAAAVLTLLVTALGTFASHDTQQWLTDHSSSVSWLGRLIGWLKEPLLVPRYITPLMALVLSLCGWFLRAFAERRAVNHTSIALVATEPNGASSAARDTKIEVRPETPLLLNDRELQIFTAVIDNPCFEISEYAKEAGMDYNQVSAWISRLKKYKLVLECRDYVWLSETGKEYAIDRGIID